MGKRKAPAGRPGFRIVGQSIVDEAGSRWDFDESHGWNRDVKAALKTPGIVRVIHGGFASMKDVTGDDALIARVAAEPGWSAGFYRRGSELILSISSD
jgi:hypothetical protein